MVGAEGLGLCGELQRTYQGMGRWWGAWARSLEEPGPLAAGEDETGLNVLLINEVSTGGHQEAQKSFRRHRYCQQGQQHCGACQFL